MRQKVVRINGYLILKGLYEDSPKEEIVLNNAIPRKFDHNRIISISKPGSRKKIPHEITYSDNYKKTLSSKSAIKNFYKEFFASSLSS